MTYSQSYIASIVTLLVGFLLAYYHPTGWFIMLLFCFYIFGEYRIRMDRLKSEASE